MVSYVYPPPSQIVTELRTYTVTYKNMKITNQSLRSVNTVAGTGTDQAKKQSVTSTTQVSCLDGASSGGLGGPLRC